MRISFGETQNDLDQRVIDGAVSEAPSGPIPHWVAHVGLGVILRL